MKKSNFFWVSFSDLMTSLFFVMLVLYVVTFAILQREKERIEIQADKFKIIEAVEKNLEELKNNESLFRYEEAYKRYTLNFAVEFKLGRTDISEKGVEDYAETVKRLEDVAYQLEEVLSKLESQKSNNIAYKNISYLLVITGNSSFLEGDDIKEEYLRSYKRAYSLYELWRDEFGIDFDAKDYHDLIEFQIAGNGTGGIGRIKGKLGDIETEMKNQRFLINIIPKIGEFN